MQLVDAGYEDILTSCYPEGVPEGFPVGFFEPVAPDCVERDLALQEKIMALEDAMLSQPQLELETAHNFADGVYVRTMFIPAGTTVSGRLHLRECVNIMVSGDITLVTVDGPVRLKAPQMFVSPAGSKKVVYANEDTVWVTTHSLPPTDPADIESILTVPSFREYRALLAQED